MKYKLLMLLFNRTGRGTYWRGFGFARELARRNYNVTVMVVSPTNKWRGKQRTIEGVSLVETSDLIPSSGYDLWNTIHRIRWLRERPFDIVHAFETRPVTIFPALSVQKRQNIPLILDWCDWFGRGGSVEQRQNTLNRVLLRPVETFFEENFRAYANGTTVINHVLRQKAIDLGIPIDQILHLPNGADTDGVQPQNKKAARERLGLPPDAPILAYTGAIFHSDAVLMATTFSQIHKENVNTRLLIVGYNNVKIEKWMGDAANAVIRTGPVNYTQLTDYIAASDVGWLPLKNHGANQGRFPMKLHDFMAAARPVVVTNVADLGKLVHDKKIGLVASDEPSGLAEKTQRLLNDPNLQLELGQQARFVAETEFAWPVLANRLDDFYQQILCGS